MAPKTSLAAALLLLLAAQARAGWLEQMGCQAQKQSVTIDGKDSDWRNAAFSEHSKLKVACVNDRSYLYIYVSPDDKDTQDQLTGKYRQEFTIWLGTSAPTQQFGLRFRFNANSSKPAWSGGGSGLPGNFIQQQGNGFGNSSWAASAQPVDASKLLRGIDILTTGRDGILNDPVPLASFSAAGVQAALGNKQGGVFYEARVPLLLIMGNAKKLPRAAGIGFETTEVSGQAAASAGASTGGGFGVNYAAQEDGGGADTTYGGVGTSRRGGGRGGRGANASSSSGRTRSKGPPSLHVWLSASLSAR